jgi:Protein of unknown function (DUF2809)
MMIFKPKYKPKYNPKYFYLTLLLLAIEICIAVFIDDKFIRPFIGDVLVVMLIYCLIRAFWKMRATVAIASVFTFACAIEVLQAIDLVGILGLKDNKLMATIIGTTFDWKDIVAYTIGAVILWLWERRGKRSGQSIES